VHRPRDWLAQLIKDFKMCPENLKKYASY